MIQTTKISTNLATVLTLLALVLFGKNMIAQSQTGDDVFVIVEEMPCWKSCDSLPLAKRKNCTEVQVFKYLIKNLKIGTMPEDLNVHSIIYVEYTIDKTGKVTNVVILRGMHPDIDDAVVKVISEMPDFIPGEQEGEPVKVKYRLPVRIHWD